MAIPSEQLPSPFLSEKVTLTHSDILTLVADEYVEVVPAPGPGLVALFQGAIAISNILASGSVYTNVATVETPNEWSFYYGEEFDNASQVMDQDAFHKILDGYDYALMRWLPIEHTDARNASDFVNSNMVNQPIRLYVKNGGLGNYTGGNAANKINVTVDYKLIEVPGT